MMLGYSLLVLTSSNSLDKNTKDLYTTGVSFYQANYTKTINNNDLENITVIPGVDGKLFKNVKCFSCNNFGHYANECPNQTASSDANNKNISANKGFSFTQFEHNIMQVDHQLNPSWVLLDTQSS